MQEIGEHLCHIVITIKVYLIVNFKLCLLCVLGGRDVDVSVVARRSQRHQVHTGASVTGGHQPESVGNGTWVLSTSSAHSEPLSHLSRSHKC